MDIKAYIESGVVDHYVSGTASEQEQREIACLRQIYPELDAALRESEAAMIHYVENFAEAPPAQLRAKVLQELPPREESKESGTPEPKLKPLQTATPPSAEVSRDKRSNFWRYAAAASLIIAISGWALWQTERHQVSEQRVALEEVLQQKQMLEEALHQGQQQMDKTQELLAIVNNPAVKKIPMASVNEEVEATATIYWDANSKETYFVRNQLPPEPTGKQYQLWYIHDSEPRSLGLVDPAASELLLKLTVVDNADAFAISLEPEGGSESPTLSQLVVLGSV